LKREQGNLGCEATLEVLQTRRYRQIWRKPLVNDIAPVTALVSDRDGRFVTFDNWLYMGDGDDTIAIYDGRGRLTRKFALADVMSQEELDKLTRSVSSTWWRGDYKLTSTDVEDAERSDELVQIQLVFGQDLTGHGRDLGERTLHIRLRDGQIIEPGIAPPA